MSYVKRNINLIAIFVCDILFHIVMVSTAFATNGNVLHHKFWQLPEYLNRAKQTIAWAIIGLAITVAVFVIGNLWLQVWQLVHLGNKLDDYLDIFVFIVNRFISSN